MSTAGDPAGRPDDDHEREVRDATRGPLASALSDLLRSLVSAGLSIDQAVEHVNDVLTAVIAEGRQHDTERDAVARLRPGQRPSDGIPLRLACTVCGCDLFRLAVIGPGTTNVCGCGHRHDQHAEP